MQGDWLQNWRHETSTSNDRLQLNLVSSLYTRLLQDDIQEPGSSHARFLARGIIQLKIHLVAPFLLQADTTAIGHDLFKRISDRPSLRLGQWA
ncbi:hypothetical protein D7W81_12045 [Corallococcus aberystwythensis]|uniref:Uncharacterized protein n=1 Tax=Corallococcus aberystwythensis TaxID=2316722 RepID=A0A3A8QLQ0_9BACT|nr:hypothetical protein D7W81_12045 [Corallococcus aberystwythensis]